MQSVSIRDARNTFSQLVTAAENGRVVVITRRGKPVARFVPFEARRFTAGVLLERLTLTPAPRSSDAGNIANVVRDARSSWGP